MRHLRASVFIIIIFGLMFSRIFAQTTIEITPGETKQGRITQTFFNQRYRFRAEAGQTYTIIMRAIEDDGDNLDPQLFLFDANDQFITENDDMEEGNRNARIIFTSEVETTYIIEATRFQQEAGTSEGDFLLLLAEGDPTVQEPESAIPDPLSVPPEFGVTFTRLDFDDDSVTTNGTLTDETPQQYFVIGGIQGDVFQITMETTGDLIANTTIIHPNFVVPTTQRTTDTAPSIEGIIPQTGWYLIEVAQETGFGGFELEVVIVRNGLLEANDPLTVSFTDVLTSQYFVVNATINERVFVNMTVIGEATNIIPNLALIDRSGETLDERESTGSQTRVSLTIPRSGVYILRADNFGTGTGDFTLSLRRNDPNIDKLRVQRASYNENYSGTINDSNPIDYYRFSGKQGELVSIQMQPANTDEMLLDPFLILTDSNLNELVFNDNAGASRTARIAQYSLPSDEDYFILATRPRLSLGEGDGAYDMSLTVGQIARQTGSLTATLTWESDADLNLFVRAPSGRTVSWANPQIPDGGMLQIDSNTGCETPTAQPVEHIFWPETELAAGDYTVWVWYQNVCATPDPVTFTLTLAIDGETLFTATSTPRNPLSLQPGERYEVGLRVSDASNAVMTNPGTITEPSPQQTASQGGDTLIVYSDTPVNGAITNEVFAQFYQFRASADDVVHICVVRTVGDLDPIVVLRDSLDNNLERNDDAEGSCDSEIIYEIEASGRYVIAVTRYGLRDGTTIGEYNLTLRRNIN